MDWEDIKMFCGIVLLVIVLMGLVFAPIVGIVTISSKQACNVYTELNTQYEFHWNFWTGCLVKLPDGYWISTERVQFVNGKLQIASPSE